MDHYTHQYVAAGAHTEPWNIAGYVFVAAGALLLVYVGCSHLASRYRIWRENKPARVLTSAEFAAALADPDGARLLRVAAPLEPYAVELGADDVVIRLAGIDAPTTTAPWTAEEGDDRVRTAVRTRLAEADEAADHPFIAVGTAGSVVVFIDPAQSPGAISIDGDQDTAKALAELLERRSAAAGHDVRFVFGPAEGAQWRWTLDADGELDTGVLGVKAQTIHLATALEAVDARNATAAAAAAQQVAAAAEADAAKAATTAKAAITADEPGAPTTTPAALLDRLGTQPHVGTAADPTSSAPTNSAQTSSAQTTSAKALLVARAEAHDDLDAVSAVDPVRAHSAELE
ncbi:MAG: hypothetical protein HOV87_07495 [Catenulispora sp.]|nr:hypothetical protein [Catenulispora sp.]